MAFAKRERILIVGDSGSGKTHATLSWLNEYLLDNPNAKLCVIDCDDSLEDLLEKPEFEDLRPHFRKAAGIDKNWFMITRYEDFAKAQLYIEKNLGIGDVLIFEGVERGWELAQDYYSEGVFGKSPAEHIMSIRADKVAERGNTEQSVSTFDVSRDWPSIRKFWKNEVLIPLTTATMYHVIATVAAKPLVLLNENKGTYNADPYIRSIFQQTGVVPEGEKSDVKRFATVVVLGIMNGKHVLSVVRLRGLGETVYEARWEQMPFWATLQRHIHKAATDAAAAETTEPETTTA